MIYRTGHAVGSGRRPTPAFVRLAAHPLRWQLLTALADSDYRVRELVARVDQPQNLVSYHLRLLRDGGLVTATRSSFDGRDSYYHLDLDRCADALADDAAPRCTRRCAGPPHHRSPRSTGGGRDASPCCSCAPATAPARRSPKHCCATTPPAA